MSVDQNAPSPIADLSSTLRDAFNNPSNIDPASQGNNSEPIPAPESKEAPQTPSEPQEQQNVDPLAQNQPKNGIVEDKTKEPSKPTSLPKGAVPSNTPDSKEPKDPEAMQMPKNLPASQQAGWKELKANAKATYDALKHTKEELKQAKTALAERPTVNNKEFEALKSEIEELRGIRSLVDIDTDPQYVKDYLEPLRQAEGELVSILKQHGVSDDQIKTIDFKDSKVVSTVYKVLEEKTDMMVAGQFKENAQAYLKALVRNEKHLKEHKEKYKEFQSNRIKESEIKGTQSKAAQEAEIDRIAAIKAPDSEEPRFPFLTTFKPREGAPEDEIQAVKLHNQYVQEMRGKVGNVLQAIKAGTPQEQAQTAIAAVAFSHAQAVNQTLANENASLKAELAKFAKAEDVKPSNGSAPKPTKEGWAANARSAESALRDAFPDMR